MKYGPRPRSIVYAVFALLLFPAFVHGQQPAGVVSAVEGQARLSRLISPVPLSLRVGENVLIRDIIDTQIKSKAQILFRGKARVSVPELTHFEVREETLPTGDTRSTIDLISGAILVNVAPQLMRPGDEIRILTPNAGAVIRGSTLFVEARDAFTQLSGSSTLSCRPPSSCASIPLTDNQFTQIAGTGPDRRFAAPTLIPPGRAAEILQSMQTGRAFTAEADGAQIIQWAIDEIAVLDNAASALVNETSRGIETNCRTDIRKIPAVLPPCTSLPPPYTPPVPPFNIPPSGGGDALD